VITGSTKITLGLSRFLMKAVQKQAVATPIPNVAQIVLRKLSELFQFIDSLRVN
jgi:hypothetical protein